MILGRKKRLWQISLSVICFLLLLTGCASEQEQKKVSEEDPAEVQFFAMDTYITFSAYNEKGLINQSFFDIINIIRPVGESDCAISY